MIRSTLMAMALMASAASAQEAAPPATSPAAPETPAVAPRVFAPQPAEAPALEPREMDPIGAWRIICAAPACVARQDVPVNLGGEGQEALQRQVSLLLSVTPGAAPEAGVLLSVATDIDIHVQPGLGLIRDEARVSTPIWRGDIEICGQGCNASGFVDGQLLVDSPAPAISMVAADGNVIAIPFSTDGMKEAIETMRAHDPAAFAAAEDETGTEPRADAGTAPEAGGNDSVDAAEPAGESDAAAPSAAEPAAQ